MSFSRTLADAFLLIFLGHTKANCDSGPQSYQNGQGQQCYNCYNYGHRKSECPNERVMKCRNCDEIGHMSREWYVPHCCSIQEDQLTELS